MKKAVDSFSGRMEPEWFVFNKNTILNEQRGDDNGKKRIAR
jgi:hypothetical protein